MLGEELVHSVLCFVPVLEDCTYEYYYEYCTVVILYSSILAYIIFYYAYVMVQVRYCIGTVLYSSSVLLVLASPMCPDEFPWLQGISVASFRRKLLTLLEKVNICDI